MSESKHSKCIKLTKYCSPCKGVYLKKYICPCNLHRFVSAQFIPRSHLSHNINNEFKFDLRELHFSMLKENTIFSLVSSISVADLGQGAEEPQLLSQGYFP